MIERLQQIQQRRKERKNIESHSHSEHPDKHHPVVSKLWQRATVASTFAAGLAEMITGNSSPAVFVDGLHNLVDAGTFGLQAGNVINPSLSPEQQQRRRKIAHTILAGTSAAVAVKAGIDLGLGSEIAQNPICIYAAGTSLGLNTLLGAPLLRRYWQKKRDGTANHHDTDLIKHMLIMDLPSAALAFGSEIIRQKYGIAEPISAIASGTLGTLIFRPTQKNLNHSHCAKHNSHEHTHEKHENEESEVNERNYSSAVPKKIRKRLRSFVAAATAASVLGGGLFWGLRGDQPMRHDFRSPIPHSSASVFPGSENMGKLIHPTGENHERSTDKKASPKGNKRLITIAKIKKPVHSGDTVWGMEKEILLDAGCRGSNTEIANSLLTIQRQNNFDINRIYPGGTVIFPTQMCKPV